MKRPAAVSLVLALTLLALFTRLYDLGGMSIWTDEGLTIYRAHEPLAANLRNEIVVQGVTTIDTHPPLYFVLMSGWIKLAGDSEFVLRFPSALWGALLVPLAYVLGKRLFKRETGLWLAALIAASPFYWWHSRDARMYTLLAVWVLLAVYWVFGAVSKSPVSKRQLLAGSLCAVLAGLTHYTGVVVAALLGGVMFVALWRRQRRWAWLAPSVVMVAAIPAVVFAVGRLNTGDFPIFRPFQEMLFETWNVFSLGLSLEQIRPLEELAIFPVMGVLGLLGLLFERKWLRAAGLVVWLFAPLLAYYLMSYIKPAYVNPRNLSPALPAYLLCIALGLTVLRRKAWPLAVIAAGVIFIEFGAAGYQQLTDARFMKDDIRALVRTIEARAQPGDAIVLHDAIIRHTFDYYYRGEWPVDAVPRYASYGQPAQSETDLAEFVAAYDRVWFVDRPAPVGFPSTRVPAWLNQHFKQVEGASFFGNYTGAHVWLYETRSPVFDQLPVDAQSIGAQTGAIELAAVRVPARVPGDVAAHIETFWRARDRSTPLTLDIDLIDARGNVLVQNEQALWPFFPIDEWPRGRWVRWSTYLDLPIGLPPGTYQLRLRAIDSGTGEALAFDKNAADGYLGLGPLTVERPTQPWPRSALTEGVPVNATWANAIDLWAWSVPVGPLRPNVTLPLDLLWQARTDLQQDYHFKLEIRTPAGGTLQTIETAVSSQDQSAATWRAGDVMRQSLLVVLPAEARGGDYHLLLQVAEAGSPFRGSPIDLGAFKVEEYPV
ncbi:MAG: glycosyltransferase family 39 protein, partial [Thermoflexales bacterium]|nr:glycosyltransferase family 39 protein [Thermoflexales bacterium]